VYLRDDILVRVVDLHGPDQDAPEHASAGVAPGRTAEDLCPLLDLGTETDPRTRSGIEHLRARCSMDPVTDRQAQDA
jgi:hypothetical protein